MRYAIAFILTVGLVSAAGAYELGNTLPEKTDMYPDYENPDVRQGGDRCGAARDRPL